MRWLRSYLDRDEEHLAISQRFVAL
jgi:hypothetical protein